MPCHCQAVERAVQDISKLSKLTIPGQIDGMMATRLESRRLVPRYNTNKDWNMIL
jgi:hypothetical protein